MTDFEHVPAHPHRVIEIRRRTAVEGATAASASSFTPSGNVAATNVQTAIQELDSEKVAKTGDTMTGALTTPTVRVTNPPQAISTGAAPIAGNAVLVAGTVTVATTAAKNSPQSIVLLTRKTNGGAVGGITYTINNGVGFTITSDSALDTSTFSWFIVDTY